VRKVAALVVREIRSQVFSPVAWVVWTLFLFIAGWMFISIVHQFQEIVENYTVFAQYMSNQDVLNRINLNDLVISGLFGNLLVVFVFVIPALTMRGFAEERRSGTDELLLTAPVGPGQIVAGKYLGLLAVAEVLVLGAVFYMLILLHFGDPERGPIVTGIIGLALAVAALTALGFAISTFTKSQVVAAVSAFVVFLLLFVVSWPAESTSGVIKDVLLGLSLPSHYEGFAKGNVSTTDVAYFLSLAALGLFAARTTIASQRWR
jgi:ABC-2 type transport system permease protein